MLIKLIALTEHSFSIQNSTFTIEISYLCLFQNYRTAEKTPIMQLTALSAISPIDGRYRSKVAELAPFFSEFGLIKYRVLVEVEYFIALCELGLEPLKSVDSSVFPKIRADRHRFFGRRCTSN